MSGDYDESLLEMFLFETAQNIAQLEQIILENERSGAFAEQAVGEIFRIMHTIKGSAAMMEIGNLSKLAHHMEDLFSFIRSNGLDEEPADAVTDAVFESIDFIKSELECIRDGTGPTADESLLCGKISLLLQQMKSEVTAETPTGGIKSGQERESEPESGRIYRYSYQADFRFEEGCQMESIRACNIICRLQEFAGRIRFFPEDIMDSDDSAPLIREKGMRIFFDADSTFQQMHDFFAQTPFVCGLNLGLTGSDEGKQEANKTQEPAEEQHTQGGAAHPGAGSIISVSAGKLDKLMDLLGELVISEAMVIHNPELKGLTLDGFQKAAQQLRKITGEIQDMVMAIRMVELSMTFQRMNRIVRDMCKKLGKQAELKIIGDQTQVDKNIIDHITDPLMHLVRNALDHGLETAEERAASGKPKKGTVTLEARNEGSEVHISVRDDGRGLDKEKILKRAEQNGLLEKSASEMTDREIYSLIYLPGFSTNESVTEFSGRGVGMDVVARNIEKVGGRVTVESTPGRGCVTTMKFPITLAIIEGMNIRVGGNIYTIPITDIKQSFRPGRKEIIVDPSRNEMIMVRGNVYPIIRLHEVFDIKADTVKLEEGIMIMIENGQTEVCLFADELLGQQEVVVKALPDYVKNSRELAGCTLLGDGQISLILDTGKIAQKKQAG